MSEEPRRRVVLLAGPSGSGKSRLTRVTGAQQLRLDDFYLADDAPNLPMVDGRIDWDDPRTWDGEGACRALHELTTTGRAVVPVYSIAQNRPTGSHHVTLDPGQVLVAEGIFAPDLLALCQEHDIDVVPVWLDRPRVTNFSRRLRRDLQQKRKPPVVLVTRGIRLARTERAMRRRVLGLGFRPMTMGRAMDLVRELQGGGRHLP